MGKTIGMDMKQKSLLIIDYNNTCYYKHKFQ